jgi:solute carrier family 13 (sodium-dependent dicarboxylate transporter), member 2/3/5
MPAPAAARAAPAAGPLSARQWAGLVLAPLIGIVLWYAPTHEAVAAQRAIAIAAVMIVLFVTEPVDHAVAGFVGLFLFWAAGVVSTALIFSGFAGETPWFLLGAMMTGAMASKSGLAQRVARAVIARTGGSYSRLLFGFIVIDFILTFLVPSGIARVTILGAIAIGVVQAFDVGPKSNIGRGLFIVITYSAGIFDKMMIAGAASILARGMIQDIGKVPVRYSQWFIAYLPCCIITIVACWLVIRFLYPPEKPRIENMAELQRQLQQPGPWTAAERRCAVYLAAAVILWMTDFIHGISPSLIGIAIALVAIAPGIGLLSIDDVRKLNFDALWFTAAALSMGRVLQRTHGLEVITGFLTAWMEPLVTSTFSSAVVLYWIGFVYHFFLANETAMLSTSMPVVLHFAQTRGLDPLATGMIWTFASGGKIFVYQSAVLIVGYSFGYFEAKDMLKVGLALTVIESLILLLLVPFYWPLLGIGR